MREREFYFVTKKFFNILKQTGNYTHVYKNMNLQNNNCRNTTLSIIKYGLFD